MVAPQKILIVDGSGLSRALIARIIRAELSDAKIFTCCNVREALALVDLHQFDLISTALMLPEGVDGLELCRQVRNRKRYRFTPVILVSGDADARLLREGFTSGITRYFNKKFGYQDLADFIRAYLVYHAGMHGRILYVEDSATAAVITRNILEQHGLEVTWVKTAEAALELLQQHKNPPDTFDLVFTDFYLADQLTGGDLLHAIRNRLNLATHELPVLVVTVGDDPKQQSKIYQAGANDFITKPFVEEVLVARIRTLLLIKHQFHALRQQTEQLRRFSVIDALTGTFNRRFLLDHGEEYLKPEYQPISVFFIDIDHFKQVNDYYGHLTGDRVLQAVGKVLMQTFPEPQHLVVRFGGEEFLVLASHKCGLDVAREADQCRIAIQQLYPEGVPVTVSVGISCSKANPHAKFDRLISLADAALYVAKDQGRNQTCVHTGTSVKPVSQLFAECELPALAPPTPAT